VIAASGQLLRILAEEGDALGARGDTGVDGQIWSFSGQPFVVLRGAVAEFRLDRTLAAAARRTPDTTPSPRGEDWVAFSPHEVDRFAEDRLRSWFGAAHRRAMASSARS
jgi:hypothetical protein